MSTPNSSTSQRPSFELEMSQGPQPGARFAVTQPVSTIGRSADNDLVIDDGDVSRRHARITWDGKHLILEDLGSANGTFVNGVRLTGPQVIRAGDTVGLAQTVHFAVHTSMFAAAPAPDEVSTAVSTPRGAVTPPQPAFPTPPPSTGKKSGCLWVLLVALLGLCVVIAALTAGGYVLLQRKAETRPLVSINTPRMGDRVVLGQPVAVNSTAYDRNKITRMELWVDGQLQHTRSSPSPDGNTPLPLAADWRPGTVGSHTLVVRAFNRNGDRGQAAISIEATELVDRDNDGIPDERDACPNERGPESAAGCPDRDMDGIPDAADRCADEAGPAETDGCPLPQDDDRDGDGVPDSVDRCPDDVGAAWTRGCPDRDGDEISDPEDACPDAWGVPEHGGCPPPADRDTDGVTDEADRCPDEYGSPDADGCPDRDGDTVADGIDACPDEWGLPGHAGCPDRDADGIADRDDACPDEPGPAETHGCSDTGAGDRDDDGVPDDADTSPDEPGAPGDGGGPGPGEGDDLDGDGVPDDEAPPDGALDELEPSGDLWGDVRIMVPVEFQALEIEIDSRDYDEVSWYAGLMGEDMERFGPYEAEGASVWDLRGRTDAEYNIHLAVPLDEPLQVRASGLGSNIYYGDGFGEETIYRLGEFIREHPPEDWDGHVITARAEGGSDGHWFQAKYRICQDSCESAEFPPPLLSLVDYPDGKHLNWVWGGREADIDAFKIFANGSVIYAPISKSERSIYIGFLEPTCGRSTRFHMTAYRGDLESPSSNTVSWVAESCPRTVLVTFDELQVGGVTRPLRDGSYPIDGEFWALGAGDRQTLEFRSHDYALNQHTDYSIAEIFAEIDRRWASCPFSGCPDRFVPDNNALTVELGPGDSLTCGGQVEDRNGILFDSEMTLEPYEIAPGEYLMHNREITLRVLIDVLVGPEAGGGRYPDLTITNVRQAGSGRLAIHVFNNAAAFDGARPIAINVVRIDDGTRVGMFSWDGVRIPSGAEEVLVTEDLGLEPHNLRLIIDPDNAVAEAPPHGDGNNIYETPIVMRVEFLSVFAPHCNENSCSIFDCDSEFVFRLWTGHGPSRSEVEWVAHNVRFPSSGELVQCGHDICRDHASPAEDFEMEGDERYTYEFALPPSDNLYVMVGGTEIDHANLDDTLGYVEQSYDIYQNWGGRSGAYSGESGRDATACDDTFCTRCPHGLTASWRITRIH